MATAKEALEKLAELATKSTSLNVAFPSQSDQSFSFRATSLHPMQVLENVHQDQVRQAIAKLKNPSPDDEQQAEKEQLAKYFLFTPGAPRLLGLKYGEEEKTPETDVADAMKALKRVKAVLNSNPSDTEKDKLRKAREALQEIRVQLVEVQETFKDPNDKVAWLKDSKKILKGRDQNQKTLEDRVKAADTWGKIKSEYNKLGNALDALEEAVQGLARITMLYLIAPFFLFRLLVQYRIDGDNITDKNRRDVSGVVTGRLNEQDWVRDWLARQMYEIDREISAYEPQVFFHLKGGRALALLLDEEGENDWDTSIVINPELPEKDWYELYNKVHDDVLTLLRAAKQEFLVLVSDKADDLKKYCSQELQKVKQNVPDPPDLDDFVEAEKETAKAELIDIGIPRRDTIEALEQWHHTKDSILIVEKYSAKIPIPGPLYYIEEYVVMVREALSNRSPSLHKTAKRIQRLANVLDAKNVDKTIAEVKEKVPDEILPKAKKLLEEKEGRVQRVMTLLLEEFSRAYRLREYAGLAPKFDEMFANDGKKPEHDDYPGEVKDGRQDYLQDGAKKNTWENTECDAILEHIAFAQTLSVQVEKHLRTRAQYFGFQEKDVKQSVKLRRRYPGQLVKALYTASAFRQEERLEVQLAVVGSHAAFLHADYSRDFVDRIDVLDPVTLLELRYYCKNEDADAKTVLDFFVKHPLRSYIDQGDINFTTDGLEGIDLAEEAKNDKITGDTIYLTWPVEVDFEDGFKYKPVILKISVEKQWPEIAFVWGYPVLSLKDLIRDYVKAAALAGEFETKYRLRGTADVLKEMLTHYT